MNLTVPWCIKSGWIQLFPVSKATSVFKEMTSCSSHSLLDRMWRISKEFLYYFQMARLAVNTYLLISQITRGSCWFLLHDSLSKLSQIKVMIIFFLVKCALMSDIAVDQPCVNGNVLTHIFVVVTKTGRGHLVCKGHWERAVVYSWLIYFSFHELARSSSTRSNSH